MANKNCAYIRTHINKYFITSENLIYEMGMVKAQASFSSFYSIWEGTCNVDL